MDYLDQEFNRIDKHLDMLLLAAEGGSSSVDTAVEAQPSGVLSRNSEYPAEIVRLVDPEKIQQKGRPKNPKSLMPLVEQERLKMAKADAKKKMKANPVNSVRFISALVIDCSII